MNIEMNHVQPDSEHTHHMHHLPVHMPHKHKKTKGIKLEGESGRIGLHPWQFLFICFKSSSRLSLVVNFLWPFVPIAIAVHYVYHSKDTNHALIFALNYIAMIPAANLIGFAGQELARKLPHVMGVLLETSLGSVTEIIIFVILIVQFSGSLTVIKAAILGSILANILLCLGLCFVAGGFRRDEQIFHEAISEVGSGLLLVAGFGLIIPAAFATVYQQATNGNGTESGSVLYGQDAEGRILSLSRATAVVLIVAYIIYVVFQTTSHHSLYTEVLEADEQRDTDRHRDMAKSKLTLFECIFALVIAITCVALIALFLVEEIQPIIETHNISDAFMGLILVPLVEKTAEHLTAIDEAYDDQANFALTHVLGASIQTALFNTPLIVLIAWGLGTDLDLNFRPFEAIVLILAIIVVGNFLRDGKSNYLEGALCVLIYVIIAVAAFYFPNPPESGNAAIEGGGESTPIAALATEAARFLRR